jgi:hypothetical protein
VTSIEARCCRRHHSAVCVCDILLTVTMEMETMGHVPYGWSMMDSGSCVGGCTPQSRDRSVEATPHPWYKPNLIHLWGKHQLWKNFLYWSHLQYHPLLTQMDAWRQAGVSYAVPRFSSLSPAVVMNVIHASFYATQLSSLCQHMRARCTSGAEGACQSEGTVQPITFMTNTF